MEYVDEFKFMSNGVYSDEYKLRVKEAVQLIIPHEKYLNWLSNDNTVKYL